MGKQFSAAAVPVHALRDGAVMFTPGTLYVSRAWYRRRMLACFLAGAALAAGVAFLANAIL